MNGTFNGLPLRKISSIKTVKVTPGVTRYTFRVLDGLLMELENRLRLNAPALLILAKEIEGWIVAFSADLHHGYEVTIEGDFVDGRWSIATDKASRHKQFLMRTSLLESWRKAKSIA